MTMGMVMFLFMPTNAAVPASPLLLFLLLSRRNPIHKQDLKTGDGDWFPESCVSVCTLLCMCVCVCERKRGKDGAGGREAVEEGERAHYIPVRVTLRLWEQMLEWSCRVFASHMNITCVKQPILCSNVEPVRDVHCILNRGFIFLSSARHHVTATDRCLAGLVALHHAQTSLFPPPWTLSPSLRHPQRCSRLSSLALPPPPPLSRCRCQPAEINSCPNSNAILTRQRRPITKWHLCGNGAGWDGLLVC